MKSIIHLIFVLFLLIGCKDNANRKTISDIVINLVGEELVLPDSLETFYPKNFLLENYYTDFNISVVVYIDGNCSKCAEDILKWDEFMKTNQMCDEVSFYFYVSANSYWSLEKFMNKNEISFPIIKDTKGRFLRINKLPSERWYHSFLLIDKKIVLIGNPMLSKNLLDLYKQEIKKELNCENFL